MDRITGSCLCGQLRIEAQGAPRRVGICHCTDCRKHHGALFYAAAIFASAAVTIRGEASAYQGRFFCPRCGSSVFARSGDETEIHLGSLDDPDRVAALAPQYECWTLRRAPWLAPLAQAAQHARDRDESGTTAP